MRYCLTLPRRCLLFTGALTFLGAVPGLMAQAPAAPAAAPAAKTAPAATTPEQKKLTPVEKEQLRIAQIVEGAAKSGASQEQVFKLIFEPIIEGNAKDQERNRRLAEECSQAAANAKKSEDAKAAEKYHALDQLLTECAKENAKVVTGYRAGSMAEMAAALKRLKQLDRRIEEISGKTMERSWFVIDEIIASAGAAAAPAAGGRAQPATPPKQK